MTTMIASHFYYNHSFFKIIYIKEFHPQVKHGALLHCYEEMVDEDYACIIVSILHVVV